jgi:hypothetical protein
MLERIVAEFDAKLENEQVLAEWSLEEQRILADLGPHIWSRVRAAIETECKKFPRHFLFEVQPDTEASVRGLRARKVLSVEYREASKTISYRCGKTQGYYSLRVSRQRQAEIVDPETEHTKTPEELAEEILALIFS